MLLQASTISERNVSTTLGSVQQPGSLEAEDDEGTEMKVIDNRRPGHQFITRASFEIPNSHSSVDSHIEFPTFREHTTKLDKSKISNGTEGTSSSNSNPFPSYGNLKCVMSTPSSVYSVMSWPSPNISMGKSFFTLYLIVLNYFLGNFLSLFLPWFFDFS